MKLFTELYMKLDRTNRTTEKVAAMKEYFAAAPHDDAPWALFFLMGNTLPRAISGTTLRQWISEATGYPLWLVEESYDAVGDLAETMALLLPPSVSSPDIPLHVLIQERLIPMKKIDEDERKNIMITCWHEMDEQQRFVWHKLVLGGFRVGVSRTLVVRALAEVAEIEPAIMAHRLMGKWQPTPENFRAVLSGESVHEDPAKPYPFFLAYPVEGEPAESLGDINEFQIEWKYDGIRSQLIRRGEHTMLWSRGEELIADRFPELTALGKLLPDGTVLDGEILAWNEEENRPAPFQKLQTRITRKNVTPKIISEVPVHFIAYDIMEENGEDIRNQTLSERRLKLEILSTQLPEGIPYTLCTVHNFPSWEEAKTLREQSRAYYTEGLMLKRRDAVYGVGRTKGQWWKWKVNPLTMDAVMTYAQRGHGRRASLYTDYTFGIWNNGELVTIAKAYSGLTDKEIGEVDAWIRRNTTDRFGPVRMVKPELVFELGFEGIQSNPRNKSGIAVRFPRILRWRKDKPADEADSLDTVKALIEY